MKTKTIKKTRAVGKSTAGLTPTRAPKPAVRRAPPAPVAPPVEDEAEELPPPPPTRKVRAISVKGTHPGPDPETGEDVQRIRFVGVDSKEHFPKCTLQVFQKHAEAKLQHEHFKDFILEVVGSGKDQMVVGITTVPKPEAATPFNTDEPAASKHLIVTVSPDGYVHDMSVPPTLDIKVHGMIKSALSKLARTNKPITSPMLLANRYPVKSVKNEEGDITVHVGVTPVS